MKWYYFGLHSTLRYLGNEEKEVGNIKNKTYYEYGENKFEKATKDYWVKIKSNANK